MMCIGECADGSKRQIEYVHEKTDGGSEKNWMCALGFLLLGLKRDRLLEAEQEILIFHLVTLSLELSLPPRDVSRGAAIE